MKCKIFAFNFDKINQGEYMINKFLQDEKVIDVISIYQVATNYQVVTTIIYNAKQ